MSFYAVLVLAAACKGPTTPTGQAITAFVSGASAFGVPAARQAGSPPASQSGGPAVNATGSASAFSRGSNTYALSSTAQFKTVFVSVSAADGSNPSVVSDGFFKIDLPVAVTAADVVVTFSESLAASAFGTRFQVASPAGTVGAATAIETRVITQPADAVVVSGQLSFIGTPLDARSDHIEDDSLAHVFREKSGLVLASPLAVDFNAPGTFTADQAIAASIPAGTRIDSLYLISDPLGTPAVGHNYNGSITFGVDVLGVMGLDSTLAAGNAVAGAPGTLYSTAGVQLEAPDTVTISANRRTVSFAFVIVPGADNIRIITASPQSSAQRSARPTGLAAWFAFAEAGVVRVRF